MTFDGLVDRLVSLFDVTTTRATDVANERLQRMATESKGIRSIKSLGTTTAGTSSYALDSTVIQVYKVKVAYTAGTANFEGVISIDDLWDIDAGTATPVDTDLSHWYAIEADADSSQATDNLRLYPTPEESGKTITGLVAIQPATITYGSGTALPVPLDVHQHLLAGCKAELMDEESRQDESAKLEGVFQAGIAKLRERVQERGVGSGRHRMRVAGYDLQR